MRRPTRIFGSFAGAPCPRTEIHAIFMNLDDNLKIGPKSKLCLNKIGIYTKSDLVKIGAVPAFVKMKKELSDFKPSLNLLYGLVAIVEDVDWRDVAKLEKGRLLMELESYGELQSLFDSKT